MQLLVSEPWHVVVPLCAQDEAALAPALVQAQQLALQSAPAFKPEMQHSTSAEGTEPWQQWQQPSAHLVVVEDGHAVEGQLALRHLRRRRSQSFTFVACSSRMQQGTRRTSFFLSTNQGWAMQRTSSGWLSSIALWMLCELAQLDRPPSLACFRHSSPAHKICVSAGLQSLCQLQQDTLCGLQLTDFGNRQVCAHRHDRQLEGWEGSPTTSAGST